MIRHILYYRYLTVLFLGQSNLFYYILIFVCVCLFACFFFIDLLFQSRRGGKGITIANKINK